MATSGASPPNSPGGGSGPPAGRKAEHSALVSGMVVAVVGAVAALIAYTMLLNNGILPTFMLPQPRLSATIAEQQGYGDDRLFSVELHNTGQAQATLRQITLAVKSIWDVDAIVSAHGDTLSFPLPALAATYVFNLPARLDNTSGMTLTDDLSPNYVQIDPGNNYVFTVLLSGLPPEGFTARQAGSPYVRAYDVVPSFVYETTTSGPEEWIAQEQAVSTYGSPANQCLFLSTDPLSENFLYTYSINAHPVAMGDFMDRMYKGSCDRSILPQ